MDNSWADADEWARSLAEHLRARADIYASETDPALRRNKAAAMVGALSLFLREVPGVTTEMLLQLKDIMIFSEDMDKGRRHPWSHPVSVGGTNIETTARTELRAWAVIAWLALADAGWPETKAYEHVAALLVQSGRSVTWRGVQGWVRAYRKGTDPRLSNVQAKYDRFWGSLSCPHGGSVLECDTGTNGRCALLPDLAERFTAWAISVPHLRDRFQS